MGDPIGALSSRVNTGGFNVDQPARRAALSSALMNFGANLSANAMRPREEGGVFSAVGESLAGAREGMTREFAVAHERNRAAEDDKRRALEFDERMAASKQGRELAVKEEGRAGTRFEREGTQFGWAGEERSRAETERQAVVEGARGMVSAIEADAGADSPEAKQARALATLGSKADMDRLSALHASIIQRKRAPEDARTQAEIQLEIDKKRQGQGLLGDERIDRALRARSTAAYERQVNEQGRRTSTLFGSVADNVRATETMLLKQYTEEEEKRVNDMGSAAVRKDGSFVQPDFAEARRKARTEALRREWGAAGLDIGPVEQELGRQLKNPAFRLQNPEFMEQAYIDLASGVDPRMIAAQIREARERYLKQRR
jgi:hypothetical protein